AVQSTGNRSMMRVYESNKDMIRGWLWIAVLDDRTTTDICLPRHGMKWDPDFNPVGHDLEWGPGPGAIHYQCRSVPVPLLKGHKNPQIRGLSDWLRSLPVKRVAALFGVKVGRAWLRNKLRDETVVASLSRKLHMKPESFVRTMDQLDRFVLLNIQRALLFSAKSSLKGPVTQIINKLEIPIGQKATRHVLKTLANQTIESILRQPIVVYKKGKATLVYKPIFTSKWFTRIFRKELKFHIFTGINKAIPINRFTKNPRSVLKRVTNR
ncbi:unnamed protein product, partial [marine sediment metagenome]